MACHGWSHYCNECEKKSLLHRSIFSAFIQILSDSFFVRQIWSNFIIKFKYFILIHLYTLIHHFKLAANCFDKNIWGEYNSSWLYILYSIFPYVTFSVAHCYNVFRIQYFYAVYWNPKIILRPSLMCLTRDLNDISTLYVGSLAS